MTKSPTKDAASSSFYPYPRLMHGLSGEDYEVFLQRSLLHQQVSDPWNGDAIMPPYSEADMDYIPFLDADQRDARRVIAITGELVSQHEDRHWFYLHPFCPLCRRSDVMAQRSCVRWLALHPGALPPLGADALPVAPREAADQRKTFLTLDDLADMPEPAMLVEGVLPIGGHGLITGRDGTCKTFVALDLTLSVVTNSEWHGRPTSFDGYGRVLFLAGEGVRSFGKRIEAWQAAHRPLHPWERQNVLVRNGTVALDQNSDAYAELAELVGEWQPDLIVFDTLQRSAGAADQNSASDMAVITERVAELRRAAGDYCTTVLVAHTTKADTDTRGSSSIEDDADFVLHCKRDDDRLRVTVAKQKDGESGQVITMHPRQVLDSLVLADQPDPARAVAWTSNTAEAKVLGALRELAPLGPQSQSAIVRQADPLAQSTTSTTLARLVRDGVVQRVGPAGRGATYQLADPTTGGDLMEQ